MFAKIYAVAIAAFGGTAQLVVTWLLHIPAIRWRRPDTCCSPQPSLAAMALMRETMPVKVDQA